MDKYCKAEEIMPGVARIGDSIDCMDIICDGSGNVFANGLPITRIQSDLTCGHCYLPTKIDPGGSNLQTVFVNGIPLVIESDPIDNPPHTCNGDNHPFLPVVNGSSSTVKAYD